MKLICSSFSFQEVEFADLHKLLAQFLRRDDWWNSTAATTYRFSKFHSSCSLLSRCGWCATTRVKLGGKCVLHFFPAARHVQSKAGPISIFVTTFSSKRATCGLHIVQSLVSQWLHLAVHGHSVKTQINLIWGITDVFQIVAQLSF